MLRDNYNIIVQPNYGEGDKPDGTWDEGDSAFSTGLNSFGGSEIDFELMPLFINDFKLVRHPYSEKNTGTAPHNNPSATSRDAVLAFFSGAIGKDLFKNKRVLIYTCLEYARSWRVNSDFLSPSNRLYLYKCCGHGAYAPPWLKIVGRINLFIDILWASWINPKHEVNQISVIAYAYGKYWLKFLYWLHPDLFGNITEYFSGWRARKEIGEAMISKIKAVVNAN